jgi:hypothetical protein
MSAHVINGNATCGDSDTLASQNDSTSISIYRELFQGDSTFVRQRNLNYGSSSHRNMPELMVRKIQYIRWVIPRLLFDYMAVGFVDQRNDSFEGCWFVNASTMYYDLTVELAKSKTAGEMYRRSLDNWTGSLKSDNASSENRTYRNRTLRLTDNIPNSNGTLALSQHKMIP